MYVYSHNIHHNNNNKDMCYRVCIVVTLSVQGHIPYVLPVPLTMGEYTPNTTTIYIYLYKHYLHLYMYIYHLIITQKSIHQPHTCPLHV